MLRTFIFIYIVLSTLFSIYYLTQAETGNSAFGAYGPVTLYLYRETEMNIIGCILSALVFYICMPILFVPRAIVLTIYWLCHVGRK